jgi:putative membrane protein
MPSDPSNERHLHPASLVFRVFGHARGFLLPAAAVYFMSRGETWQIWAALFFVPVLALDVFRYLTLRWRYDADELVVREGWIFRSERHVPYARIQNVDLKQNVLHRALSVAEVRIETAGGSEAEVSLSVVGMAAYEELRERAFAGRAAAVATPTAVASPSATGATECSTAGSAVRVEDPPVEVLLQLSLLDVLLLGLHPGRGLALLAIGWGFAREFGLFEDWERRAESITESSAALEWFAGAATVLLVVGGVLALLALSLAASVVEFANFRLEAQGNVFRVRRGLLTREVQTIPRGRIQVATVERPWFLGLLGRARVHVRTAGGVEGNERGRQGGGRHFAPIVRSERVPEILTRIRAGFDIGHVDWRPLGRTAPRRFLIGALIPVAAVSVLAISFLEWVGVGIALAWLAWTVVVALRRGRRAAWSRAPWGLVVREGAFSTAEHATFVDKMQSVELHENPLDRRHGHVTLHVDTAGPATRGRPDVAVHYLPREAAESLREDLVGAAAEARFRW